MHKKYIVAPILVFVFLVSFQTAQAFSFKKLVHNVFGSKTKIQQQATPPSVLGASATDDTKSTGEKPEEKTPSGDPSIKEEPKTPLPPIIAPGKEEPKPLPPFVDPRLEPAPKKEPLPPIYNDDTKLRKPAFTPAPTSVSFGTKGSEFVKQIQKKLIEKGYLSGTASGNYLGLTKSAVLKFQQDNGIAGGDGTVVGPRTLSVLGIKLGQKPGFTTGGTEQILFLGGISGAPSYQMRNDVYSSSNMFNWNLISPNDSNSTTKWSPRADSEVVYFSNTYWVIQGIGSPSGTTNDIWSSTDGINWTLANSNPPFTGEGGRAVVFDNKIFFINGYQGSAASNGKVWSSSDGINWDLLNANTPFGARDGHAVISYMGRIYVIGGFLNDGSNLVTQSDIWSSSDGINWIRVTANAPWGKLQYAKALVYNNKIYLIGGAGTSGQNPSNKVWSSNDGTNWNLVSSNLPISNSSFSTSLDAVVANGEIWLGDDQLSGGQNNLWSTGDGITWTQSSAVLPWSPRSWYRFVSNQTLQSTPTITITAPNGAEVYTEGQQADITWTSSNLPASTPVFISLIVADQNNNPLGDISLTPSVLNDGQETIILPTIAAIQQYPGFASVVAGQHFKVIVGTDAVVPSVYDSSDDFFTITNQVSSLCPAGSPDLSVTLSPTTPPTQMIAAGTNDVLFAKYTVTACANISMDALEVDVVPNSSSTVLRNMHVDMADPLGNTIWIAPTITNPVGRFNAFQFPTPISFSAGSQREFLLYSDVIPQAVSGTHIQLLLSGVRSSTSSMNLTNQPGNIFTIANQTSSFCPASTITTPTMKVSLSSATPGAQVVPAGMTSVKLAEYILCGNQSFRIATMSFDLHQINPLNPLGASNLRLETDGPVQSGPLGSTIATPKIIPSDGFASNTFGTNQNPLNLMLVPGLEQKVSVYMDVNSSAQNGTQFNAKFAALSSFPNGANVQLIAPLLGSPVTVATQTSSTCSINSFIVPASTTIASGLSIPVSWSSNCNNVVLEANSGSYTLRYVGSGSGSHTFVAPASGTVFSNADSAVDVTLIVGLREGGDTASSTKSVSITDVSSPASNQCQINNLTATPNPASLSAPQTVLSWQASPGCIVYVEAWEPTDNYGMRTFRVIKAPGVYYFNSTDSTSTINLNGPTTYYVSAQAGGGYSTVLSAKTVDVKMSTGQPFIHVTSPNDGPELWNPGMHTVTWDTNITTSVKVRFCFNSSLWGYTCNYSPFSVPVVAGNLGTVQVNVLNPSPGSEQSIKGYIRAEDQFGNLYDESDSTIKIVSSSFPG